MKQHLEAQDQTAREWPDELDALVAASQFHTLLLENDRVRMLETLIRPGETVPVHTHRWPGTLYVLSWGDYVRRDGDGNVTTDTRENSGPSEPPRAIWLDALAPHSLENVGNTDIHVIHVELKDGGATAS